jgi:hypothetical protein
MKIGGGLNNENLVFGYDSQGFSFGGEPTTNLVPSPQHNSNFTIQNGWSTYNTNQYNGNTYFSIGTISSVADNIVILGTVGRTIRSFDVLKPQTSGGGVTAGTNYVIKKINDTNSFSLHEYNSSQNGSQGYINPDTGFFKVHDAYANDTRISINATDFPTMWWGGPHLPNSGLIKEIVPNEGRRHGTNAMRLHAYRPDGVVDGMAYGVNTPVTQGDVVTVSVWLKLADGRGEGKSLGYSTYFGSGFSGSSTSFGPLTTQWKKYEYSWTASNTYSFISYWWPNSPTQPYAIDMCDFQVEVNKGEATKFVAGTRSNTEALLDLGPYNFTLDTSGIEWSSVQHPHFHGASHKIELSSNPNVGDSSATWEFIARFDVVYPTDTSVYRQLYIQESSVWIAQYVNRKVGIDIAKDNGAWFDGSGGSSTGSMIGPVNSGTWYHLLFTWDGTQVKGYFNSELQFTTAVSGLTTIRSGTTPRRIGMRTYNVALTQEEVIQNYLSFKPRFGLG